MWKLIRTLSLTSGFVLTVLSAGLNPAAAADESHEAWRLIVVDQQNPG